MPSAVVEVESVVESTVVVSIVVVLAVPLEVVVVVVLLSVATVVVPLLVVSVVVSFVLVASVDVPVVVWGAAMVAVVVGVSRLPLGGRRSSFVSFGSCDRASDVFHGTCRENPYLQFSTGENSIRVYRNSVKK